MNSSKSIFKSKTFWGSLVAILPTVLALFKVDTSTAGQVVTIAGGLFAAYGRWDATQEAHVLPPTPPSQDGLD